MTGRDAAPMAVSDVTYHVCSSSAPLPAPAHPGCPGRCCGSCRTRPAALGPEESSRERYKRVCWEGTVNGSLCILGWSLRTSPGHIPSPARPCCYLGPASGPQHAIGRHGMAQAAALKAMAWLSTICHRHKPAPGSPPGWETNNVTDK